MERVLGPRNKWPYRQMGFTGVISSGVMGPLLVTGRGL